MGTEPTAEPRFDVAVSFAGEDRAFVEEVVRGIGGDCEVFYDQDFMVETWGRDLIDYFTDLYQNKARYVVIFVSAKYAEKSWTTLERRSALAGALLRQDPYVLPVRLDDTELPGLLPTVGYIDARRVGLMGIVQAINAKLAGKQVPTLARAPLLDGRVPRSPEAVQALIAEKPSCWEYMLFASMLMANFNKLEGKYRDHTMAYASRNRVYVNAHNLVDFVQAALGSILAIVENFNSLLGQHVQDAAFGRPGEPGDVDRILHLAERFASVYDDFMNWAAELRGVSATGDHTQLALRTLARASDQPVESVRAFVRDFVREADTLNERLLRGEHIYVSMTITLELDTRIMAEHRRQVKLALKRER